MNRRGALCIISGGTATAVRRCCWLAAIAVVLPAAAEPLFAAQSASVRDSAGVRIVENAAPLWQAGEGWRVARSPSAVIGGWDADGAQAIFSVSDATILENGSVAVMLWNRNLFELRVFDVDGGHLTTFGRSGQGPFEVGASPPLGLGWVPGDSLVVVSADNRVSVFGPEGERYLSERVAAAVPLIDADPLTSRTFIGWRPGRRAQSDDWRTSYRNYFVATTTETSIDTIASVPSRRAWGEGEDYFVMPFGPRSHLAVWGETAWLGDARQYEVRGLSLSGGLSRIVRNRRSPTPVSEAMADEYLEWQRDAYSNTAERQRAVARFHRAVEFPEQLPAYGHVEADTDGRLWVLQYEPPWSTVDLAWDVYRPDGVWLGVVSMPFSAGRDCRRERTGCLGIEIGRDVVLSRDRDEFGAEIVKLYPISR